MALALAFINLDNENELVRCHPAGIVFRDQWGTALISSSDNNDNYIIGHSK